MNDFEVTPAPYGFSWGPAVIERMASDPKWGIVIRIQGVPGEYVDVRVSPKGRKVSVTGPHLREELQKLLNENALLRKSNTRMMKQLGPKGLRLGDSTLSSNMSTWCGACKKHNHVLCNRLTNCHCPFHEY